MDILPFPKKIDKMTKKVLFHLFDLFMINAHTLHSKINDTKMLLKLANEKVAEGKLSVAGTEILRPP